MFNLGFQELLIVFALIMLLFGPSQLPKLARGLGNAMREFRKATDEVGKEIKGS